MDAPISFTSFDAWHSLAETRLSHPFAQARIRCGPGYLVVDPAIAVHDNLAVLTSDWIPVRPDGAATFERMVHSPGLYLRKALAVRGQDGAWVSTSTVERQVDSPLVLVGGSTNYYHWLADYLPRLLVADMFPDHAGWPFLLNSPLAPFQQEALDMLGISEEAMVCVEAGVTVRAPKVLVPTLMSYTTMMHPQAIAMVRDAFPPLHPAGPRRVYLSRRDASTRRLLNEEALIALLESYGFETFVPGQMAFQAQIDLCAGAEAVVAVHGAGMANLIFCGAGTEVFEIAHPLRQVTSMQVLAHYLGQSHRFIDAETVGTVPYGNPLRADWEVDLEKIRRALDAVFGNVRA